MSYTTVTEISDLFKENEIDYKPILKDADITSIIIDVDAVIDAALYRKYVTPFMSPPQLIKTISKYLSYAEALQRVAMGSNGALVKPEAIAYYRDSGNIKLNDLREGRLEVTGSKRMTPAATTY